MSEHSNKLIAFGCSITYGHGLKDCSINNLEPGPYPSKFAWPSIVGNKLKADVFNLSHPGASNDQILYDILNFNDYEKGDHVIILWSYLYRAMLFTNEGEYLPLSPNRMIHSLSVGPREWESFYKAHDDYDLWIRTVKNIHHASCYLESKQVKISSAHFDPWAIKWKTVTNSYIKNMDIDLAYINLNDVVVDKALDSLHPGEESQKNIAEIIYKIHREKYDTAN